MKRTLEQLDAVKGWFFASDRAVFRWVLEFQRDHEISGDLLELGCYLGKSAILLGSLCAPNEKFTVLDLFEGPAGDPANTREMAGSYSTLTKRAFEENYLSFHDELPEVIVGLSSGVVDHVAEQSCRFVHVDASHLYEHVRGDIQAANVLLVPDGVVALDDYRSEHTPGVACAVWEAVLTCGLKPLWLTEAKFYGTWGDPTVYRESMWSWIQNNKDAWGEYQQIAGHEVIRMKVKAASNANSSSLPVDAIRRGHDITTAEEPAQAPATSAATPSSEGSLPPSQDAPSRRILQDLTPPAITRGIARLRERLGTDR